MDADETIYGASRAVLEGTARVRFQRFDLPAIIALVGNLIVVDGVRTVSVTSVRPLGDDELELDLMGGVEIEPAQFADALWELTWRDGEPPAPPLDAELMAYVPAAQRAELERIQQAATERFARVKIAERLRLIAPLDVGDAFTLLELTLAARTMTIEARDAEA